jgi:hypothetical protein
VGLSASRLRLESASSRSVSAATVDTSFASFVASPHQLYAHTHLDAG